MSDIPDDINKAVSCLDENARRDLDAIGAIAAIRRYLSDCWISEDCHEYPVMGCSSCQAAILQTQLTMLGNSIRENLGEDMGY